MIDASYTNQEQRTWDGPVDATVSRAPASEDFSKPKRLLKDPAVNAFIDREIALGEKREARSTPTSLAYLGSEKQRVAGSIPYRVMKRFLGRIFK